MVCNAGGYHFIDFVKMGIPLNLLSWAIAITFIRRRSACESLPEPLDSPGIQAPRTSLRAVSSTFTSIIQARFPCVSPCC